MGRLPPHPHLLSLSLTHPSTPSPLPHPCTSPLPGRRWIVIKQDYLEDRQFSFVRLFPWVWILSFVATCTLYGVRIMPATGHYPVASMCMLALLAGLWAVFYSLWRGNAGVWGVGCGVSGVPMRCCLC